MADCKHGQRVQSPGNAHISRYGDAFKSDNITPVCIEAYYVGVLISLWLLLFPVFLFAAQPKKNFLDGLKKLQQRSHKCVELRGNM
jgi:hypothetical protein